MKIAINRCYGGFGLSDEAFERLLNLKGIEFEKRPAKFSLYSEKHDYWDKGHAGEDEHFLTHYTFTGWENRTDPDLISVIEEMGEKSWGSHSELNIVDVPDDVEWQIAEYDGIEWVAEKHRTWR